MFVSDPSIHRKIYIIFPSCPQMWPFLPSEQIWEFLLNPENCRTINPEWNLQWVLGNFQMMTALVRKYLSRPCPGCLFCPPWPLYHDDINPRPDLEKTQTLALAFNNQIMSALALTSPWIAAVSNPSFPTIQWADKIQRHPTEPWIKQMWWLNFLQGWYIEIGEGWRKERVKMIF